MKWGKKKHDGFAPKEEKCCMGQNKGMKSMPQKRKIVARVKTKAGKAWSGR